MLKRSELKRLSPCGKLHSDFFCFESIYQKLSDDNIAYMDWTCNELFFHVTTSDRALFKDIDVDLKTRSTCTKRTVPESLKILANTID